MDECERPAQGTALAVARSLQLPSREDTLRRTHNVQAFWQHNRATLEEAWAEWELEDPEAASLPPLDESVLHPALRAAIADAWADPAKMEHAVRDLWTEVTPGVYSCQFLDPERIGVLRAYFDRAAEAQIPTRPPFGIVLNRKGFMLDRRSEGYLAIPSFQAFYALLMDTYMRPLGRLFYPDYIQRADDSQTFGFSIAWTASPDGDKNIQRHSDHSALTLNVNMNIPSDNYEGSSLYFVDQRTGEEVPLEFAPGMAVMHRGAAPHASLPITQGERHNMVLWLYGAAGSFSHSPYSTRMTPEERWTKPQDDPASAGKDYWAPF